MLSTCRLRPAGRVLHSPTNAPHLRGHLEQRPLNGRAPPLSYGPAPFTIPRPLSRPRPFSRPAPGAPARSLRRTAAYRRPQPPGPLSLADSSDTPAARRPLRRTASTLAPSLRWAARSPRPPRRLQTPGPGRSWAERGRARPSPARRGGFVTRMRQRPGGGRLRPPRGALGRRRGGGAPAAGPPRSAPPLLRRGPSGRRRLPGLMRAGGRRPAPPCRVLSPPVLSPRGPLF